MTPRRSLPAIVLGAAGLCAALFGSFLRVAPNRLLSGQPHESHGAVFGLVWLAVMVCGWFGMRRRGALLAVVAVAVLVALPVVAALDARTALEHVPASARAQLGAGFWVMWMAAALLLLDALRGQRPTAQVMAWVAVVAALIGVAWHGVFGPLAVVREYQAQQAPFDDAFLVHLRLVGVTFVAALSIGAPMGWWAWRARRGGGVVVGTLSFLQTVPSLALFALLIGPFSWLAARFPMLASLGFGGTGAAPAIVALVLYALLPVVRYTMAGLDAVPVDTREAAQALGMSRWQVLAQVQLPLGWPVLLSGLRIVAVQTIGLAAVATLIGAGGLGRFVFLGIGQGAIDMVLLGTLAIIALALVVDMFFQGLLALAERHP